TRASVAPPNTAISTSKRHGSSSRAPALGATNAPHTSATKAAPTMARSQERSGRGATKYPHAATAPNAPSSSKKRNPRFSSRTGSPACRLELGADGRHDFRDGGVGRLRQQRTDGRVVVADATGDGDAVDRDVRAARLAASGHRHHHDAGDDVGGAHVDL